MMFRLRSLFFTFLITVSVSASAGDFKVNGEVVGDSSVIEYVTANYEARNIKIVTNGSAHFSRIDDSVDEPGATQQQLVVDDVVIGSSDLITWFLINPNNNNVRLKTNGNLEIIVDQPARNPQIIQFKASAATITAGDEVTLTWKSTDTDYCAAGEDFILSGQLASNGSDSFTEATVGNRSYQLTCFAELNGEAFETTSAVSVTVEEGQSGGGNGDSGIQSFIASSVVIGQGESITLTWRANSNDVNFCKGVADFDLGAETNAMPINSSKTFTESRLGQRTYSLHCIGAETYTAQLTVNVVEGGNTTAPKIRTFSSNNTQPLINENFTITWDAINVDSCSASGAWSGSQNTNGSASFNYPNEGPRTFTLSCTENATGITVEKSVNVTVVAEAVPGNGVQIISFTGNPNPVQVGSNVTLSWNTVDAISCKAEAPFFDNWVGGLPATGSRAVQINQAGDIAFKIRCYEQNNTSKSVTRSVTVSTTGTAQPAVAIILSVNKTQIVEGEEVVFNWSSSNATSCVTVGIAPGWAGDSVPTSGTKTFVPRHDTMSFSYAVDCSNATSSDFSSVTIASARPAQELGTNNCAVPFETMEVKEWTEVWPEAWPNPNSKKITYSLNQGQNSAIHFNTGPTLGVSASLTSAAPISTPTTRTASLSQCPGDYTFGRGGVGVIDQDCIQNWGEGSLLTYTVSDETNPSPTNGICELLPNTDYYLNIRFSSACTGSYCAGIFQYGRNN